MLWRGVLGHTTIHDRRLYRDVMQSNMVGRGRVATLVSIDYPCHVVVQRRVRRHACMCIGLLSRSRCSSSETSLPTARPRCPMRSARARAHECLRCALAGATLPLTKRCPEEGTCRSARRGPRLPTAWPQTGSAASSRGWVCLGDPRILGVCSRRSL